MVQEIAYSPGGCDSKCTLKGSCDLTSIVDLNIADGSLVLSHRISSGASE